MADKEPTETELLRAQEILATAVSPSAPGFRDRITPKEPDPKSTFFYACPTVVGQLDKMNPTDDQVVKCGGIHYRHAGYVQNMLPYLKHGGEKKVGVENVSVMVCVKCRHSYVWLGDQMYDVTANIDLGAWEKFEIVAHKAIGPGGNC